MLTALIIVLIIGAVGIFFYQQQKTKSAAEGKLYCTFLTPDGSRREELLPIVGNQVFHYDKKRDTNVAYTIKPNKTWNFLYPPLRPKFFQITVKSALFVESNPEPLPWIENDPVITAEVLGNLQDINFSEILKQQAREAVEATQFKIPLLFYLLIGVPVVISVIVIFLLFQIMSSLGI